MAIITEIDLLLSDEFVQYSADIAQIHKERKELKEALEAKYQEFQVNAKRLSDAAAVRQQQFEEWAASKRKKKD